MFELLTNVSYYYFCNSLIKIFEYERKKNIDHDKADGSS